MPKFFAFCWLQLCLLASLGLYSATTQAANCPPNSCCKDDTAHGAPAACVGNPINLVSGNKYQMEVDMPALPGVLGLELVRHYNSENSRILPGGADGKGRNDNIGVLGRGWRLGYDRQIIWAGEGTRQGELLTLVEGDGRRLLFTRSLRDTLVYEGRGEAAGQIIRVRPAQERARLPAHVGWRYEWLVRGGIGGGLREHFDAKGWMVARMAPTGEMLAIRRNTIGWPLTVTDPQGRQLVLHYMSNQERAANRKLPDSQHKFSGVQHIDTPVGRFSYRYGGHDAPLDAKNAQVQPMDVAANLRAVEQPGQITRHYHYEDLRWPTLLSGISVQAVSTVAQRQEPSQRIVTWLYDSQGRAVLSVHAAPARLQRNAQGQPIKPARLVAGTGIDQVFISWPKTNEAELINALGQRTHYQMANIAGQLRVVESRGPSCPSCTPGNTRWRYNEAGQVLEQTRINPQGQSIEGQRWQYDVTGRMVAEQAVRYHTRTGKPVEQVVNLVQYANAYRNDNDHQGREVLSSVAPQIITRPSVVPGKQQETHIRYNDRGQPLEVIHKGWRPATEAGQSPQAIERSTRYQYQLVNGRSVLSQVDGPLPNGPQNSPQDSDITRYTWDARGGFVVAVDTPQGQSQITYDAAGRVASVSSERGATHWTYNGQQLTQVEQSQPGWLTQKQTYAYDAHGRMTEKTGHTKRAYDPAGRLLWQASAMGVLETNQWDALGQLTQTKRLTNAITQENNYAYDEQGRITQLSDNRGRATRITYDERGRPSLIADQSGRVLDLNATTSKQDASTPSPVTPSPQQWRDDFGRVVATRSPDHGLRTQQYDAANRLIAMRDALGNHSQYQYDVRGRIARQTVASGGEPSASIQTTWRYEGDHLVELIHPTQSERYTYDERGLRTSKTVVRPSGKDSTLAAVTRYAYNEQGQLTGTSLPDGSWITYSRNGQGQVVALKRSPIHPLHLRWLAWLLPEQTIAQDFERDMVGLRSYTQGNGLQTRYQRSQEGVLARVYVSKPVELKTKEEQAKAADKLLQMLGIQAAMAKQTQASKHAPSKDQAADPLATLGALGIQTNPQALIDHRYLWDTRGNLLYTRSGAKQTEVQAYAYDGANRLVVSVHSEGKQDALKEKTVNRYFYQGSKRVLQQQNAAAQSDIQTHTLRVNHKEGTHQWTGATQAEADYDAAGQPSRLGQRRFKWDAYGRLVQVSRDAGQPIAHYTYNHRGERIHKSAGKEDTAYLYDDSRQLQAELNNKKHITRQYIYLADMPLAVIDTPEGASLEQPHSGLSETLHELGQVISAVFANQGSITYLHANHLGAVEAATNDQGQVIWQAAYVPFGKAHVQTRGASKAFALNLRLPGQYEDAEIGLHYNDHRYYAPARGEYISPDPLGNPNGSNTYAYVASNPLNAVDPLGLILFAFDGTGNDLSDAGSITNVARLTDLYLDGNTRYVAGVGTVHEDDKWGDIPVPLGDAGHNGSGARRIERMMTYLMEEARATEDKTPMAIDIVGFSRGAAQARDFANNIIQYSGVSVTGDIFNLRTDERGWLHYNASVRNASGQMVRFEGRQCVQLRFMGLWDTVLSTNSGRDYRLGIPAQFAHVVHAVALNEYRADETAWNATRRNLDEFSHWGGFPLVSIGASTKTTNQVRIERGFIGAHADIGGGYPAGENQLSFVALSWMVSQARSAGVQIGTPDIGSAIPTANPLIHDQSNALRVGRPTGAQGGSRQFTVGGLFGSSTYMVEDRVVQGAVSGVRQRDMGFTSFGPNDRSMLNAETMNFISYLPRNLEGQRNNAETWETRGPQQVNSGTNQTGRVDIGGYMQWLRAHGYCFAGDECDRKAQK